MSLKKFLFFVLAISVVATLLASCLAPLAVSGGLRLWLAWIARNENLRIEVEKIEAPLLRPAVVRGLRITSPPNTSFRMMVEAPRVEVDLNLAGIFSRSRGRILRSLTAEGIHFDFRQPQPSNPTATRFDWRVFEFLLADKFKLEGVELHLENGETIFALHDGQLTAAEIETGIFTAREIAVASPWLHKTFSQLRGATSWQENQLTLGALTLTPGLDLDSLKIDLAHISEGRLGLQLSLDAFGGKLRASVVSEDHEATRAWDAAGTASGISLAQMSDALDLADRASGSLHSCNFTFRGGTNNLQNATAAIWAEVSGLTWRDRTADTIMVGASLYNRQLQIEQLYVKQRNNQLTLSGESELPQKLSDWLKPDFRGDISASIEDLGEFARLFGAKAADFGGRIEIEGSANARDKKLEGQLTFSGRSLVLFQTPVESFDAKLGLNQTRVTVDRFELRSGSDLINAQGNADLAGDRSYSAKFSSVINDAANYAAWLPAALKDFKFGGNVALEWEGSGAPGAHSGAFHFRGRNLVPLSGSIYPFDAELEGDYAPENIFFRQFHIANLHTDLSAFVTIAKNYVQLQTLRLDLEGKPKLQGNVFLPISLSKFRATGNWLTAITDDPNFDVDLTLDPIDLGDLAATVSTIPKVAGKAAGNVQLYGTPGSLDGRSDFHLRDFSFRDGMGLSADFETRLAGGIAQFKTSALPKGSDPVKLEGIFPLGLLKQSEGYDLDLEGPFTAALDFPAVFLKRLPPWISRGIFSDGILSGHIAFSNSLQHPRMEGEAQLVDGRLMRGWGLSAGLKFEGQTAHVSFARISQNAFTCLGRGGIDLRELADIIINFSPADSLADWSLLTPDDCIGDIVMMAGQRSPPSAIPVSELIFRGSLFSPAWTVSLTAAGSSRTFPFCRDENPSGKTLAIGSAAFP